MLASERSVPPNQMGRARIRSLTTIRYVCPLRIGQLVDPDDLRPRRSRSPQLRRHVLLLQRLDRLPVQMGLPGNIANRRDTTPPSHPEGKTLRVKGIVGQPLQTLLLHLPATSAQNASDLHIQPNTPIPAGKIPHPTNLAIVKRPVRPSAGPANRFFPRRRSLMTRAYGSPKIPDNLALRREPRETDTCPTVVWFFACRVHIIFYRRSIESQTLDRTRTCSLIDCLFYPLGWEKTLKNNGQHYVFFLLRAWQEGIRYCIYQIYTFECYRDLRTTLSSSGCLDGIPLVQRILVSIR